MYKTSSSHDILHYGQDHAQTADVHQYLFNLSHNLKIKHPEDWYSIRTQDIMNNDGKYVLEIFGNSIMEMLQRTFPEYPWIPWKFSKLPHGFWNRVGSEKQYLDYLARYK
jgi:hypothetical protein